MGSLERAAPVQSVRPPDADEFAPGVDGVTGRCGDKVGANPSTSTSSTFFAAVMIAVRYSHFTSANHHFFFLLDSLSLHSLIRRDIESKVIEVVGYGHA
jgi:hypothetical protein